MAACMHGIDEDCWDVQRTQDFIVSHGFKRVALQLPDDLLQFSPGLAALLSRRLGPAYTIAVLADTAFNAEAVDEVAARHMDADCVIHYGRASLAAVSQLPVCYVFPRLALDVRQAAQDLAASFAQLHPPASNTTTCNGSPSPSHHHAVLLLDQGFLHAAGALHSCLQPLLPEGWSVVMAQPAATSAVPHRSPSAQTDASHHAQGRSSTPTTALQQKCSSSTTTTTTASPSTQSKANDHFQGCSSNPTTIPQQQCSSNATTTTCASTLSNASDPSQGCSSTQTTASQQQCSSTSTTIANGCACGSAHNGCGAGPACCMQGEPGFASAQQPQQQQQQQQQQRKSVLQGQGVQGEQPGSLVTGAAETAGGADGATAGGCGSAAQEHSTRVYHDEAASACAPHMLDTTTVAGYTWQQPTALCHSPGVGTGGAGEQGGGAGLCDTWFVWVGPQASTSLQALQLALSTQHWLRYTPATPAQPQLNGVSATAGEQPPAPPVELSQSASGVGGRQGDASKVEHEGGGAQPGQADAQTGEKQQGSGQGTTELGLCPCTHALLKRRYFLVEKAKGASIVGILVGTLAVAGLKEAMAKLRRLIAAADKHSYTMLVGKPNPTKLANFPEVDVWVMLADPLGYVLDSKPYLAPILTPYEALLALTGRSLPFDEPYVLDLRCLAEADASEVEASRAAEAEEAPGALVASGRGQVARLQGAGGQQLSANNAAEYLQLVRSFKGLEAPVAGAAPKAPTAAVEGQRGRAAVYRHEGLQ